MKKTLFIIPLALVVFVCWAANDVSFKQFVTEKYRSSTITFDVNSQIQDDTASQTWNFNTSSTNAVLRSRDVFGPSLTLSFQSGLTVTGAVNIGTGYVTNITAATATVTNAAVSYLTNSTAYITNLTIGTNLATAEGVGLTVTNDVLMHDSTTNRMIYSRGILISNIANFSAP